MSNSYRYNPRPPRAWSRVQNPCTFTDASNNVYKSVYIPLTNQTVTLAQANYEDKLLQKGNILQYKGNSSQLTKKQKYSQLAKGFGPNRTKVFATQSQTYTNPNTTGLLRVNSTTLPFPNDLVGQPNNISGPFQYAVPNPDGCTGFSVQDGGNLVCGTYVNPCTGAILQTGATSSVICNPASASDVPGSTTLCWDTKVQTWFPRQRYVMTNSGNKWPEGYKGFVSAVTFAAPFLTVDVGCCDVVLNWVIVSSKCTPISSYNIYQNDNFVKSVPYPLTSTTINNLNYNVPYSFYVTAVSNNIQSLPSNVVTTFIDGLSITLSASAVSNDNRMVTLNWISDANQCANGWRLYQNGALLNSYPVGTLTATISGLIAGNTYTYYVNSLNPCAQTSQSNTVTVNPINDIVQQPVSGSYTYTYTVPSGALYYNNVTVIGGGGGGGGGPLMITENASGKIGGGGGGGGGIAIITNQVPITLPRTFIYNVGSGGAGGASASGTSGNNSTFFDGLFPPLVGTGGGGGSYNNTLFVFGNTTFNIGGFGGTGIGGNIVGVGGNGGISGGVGSPTNNNVGFDPVSQAGTASSTANGPGGGGGGGCIYRTSGVGGVYFYSSGSAGGNGGNGAVGGTAGQFLTPAGNGSGTIGFGGSGGGGVGGNSFSNSIPTGNAGSGIYGSGGGGGGASHTSTAGYGPGNGGAGGTGFVGFTVYRMIIS